MTWLQRLAWEEAFAMLSRSDAQIKKMGFASRKDAALFEFNRVSKL